MMKYVTVDGLIDMLVNYKENYGGGIPVLLSDRDSPNSLTNLANTFVIDITEEETGESQMVVLLTNMDQKELLEDPGFDFEDGFGDDE